jgi:hypothetical protein
MQKIWNMLKSLKKHLISFSQETRQLFIVRWNTWKANRATKRQVLVIDAEAFAVILSTKDEFIVYLQDEIAQLKAKYEEKSIERVVDNRDFKGARGYKSVHTKIREAVEANRRRHIAVVVAPEEEKYEQEVIE